MHILSIRRLPPGGNGLARFDVETPWGLRLYNMKLSRNPKGFRVHAPGAFGSPAVTFDGETNELITRAALAAFGDVDRDEHHAA